MCPRTYTYETDFPPRFSHPSGLTAEICSRGHNAHFGHPEPECSGSSPSKTAQTRSAARTSPRWSCMLPRETRLLLEPIPISHTSPKTVFITVLLSECPHTRLNRAAVLLKRRLRTRVH